MRALALEQRTTDPTEGTQREIAARRSPPLAAELEAAETKQQMHWDEFYKCNKEKFFKDRMYLGREFPMLDPATADATFPWKTCMEIGCGVGNTLVPLLRAFPDRKFYASDFAPNAVEMLKVRLPFLLRHGAHRATLGQLSVQSRAVRCVRVRHREGVGGAARRACGLGGRGDYDIRALGDRPREDARRYGPRQGGTHSGCAGYYQA